MRLTAIITGLLLAGSHASDIAAWPKSQPLTFWTRNATPYTDPVQDVCIGDTRFGAPPGYRAIACTNLWTLRAE